MEIKNVFVIVASCIVFVSLLVAARNYVGGDIPTAGSATQNSNLKNNAETQAPAIQNGIQEVKLSMKGWDYVMEPSAFKKGVPVRMTVDMSTVTGCMRDIVIPSFGVRKTVSTADNIITFTPDKAGTFNIACSMNMGRGQFTVVEADGTKTDYVETAPVLAGGCGMAAGGGCGCGGRAA